MIIAMTGVIGAGKNFQADLLIKQGYVPLDFKDALIYMVEDIVGFKIRDHYDLFKECVIGTTKHSHPSRMSASHMSKEILKICPDAMTGRKLLQQVGTAAMRKRDPDYWVRQWTHAAIKLIKQGKNIVTADCRFPNEVEHIKFASMAHNTEYKYIFCDYHSSRYDATMRHESEELAQRLLAAGCKDLQELSYDFIRAHAYAPL